VYCGFRCFFNTGRASEACSPQSPGGEWNEGL
jgi:hypothetical protein